MNVFPRSFKKRLETTLRDESRCLHGMATAILLAGVILRFRAYLANRSLWLDEAFIANPIVSQSWSDLFKPLEYGHRVPPLFLVLVKSSVHVFGDSDLVLRFIPFCAGLLSLFVFYHVSRRILSPIATVIAMSFFAFSAPLVYFSSELKQYATDVAITLLLIYLTQKYIEHASRNRTSLWAILLGVSGTAAVWTSHPSVFILAASGFLLIHRHASRGETSKLFIMGSVCLCWAANFGFMYFLFIRDFGDSPITRYITEFWRQDDAFMPLPFHGEMLPWLYRKSISVFQFPPMELQRPSFIAFILVMVGVLSKIRHDPKTFFLLICPIFLTLAASTIEKYPVHERMILFWSPLLILLLSAGMDAVGSGKRASLIPIVLAAILLWPSAIFQMHLFIRPKTVEEIKPVLEYVRRNYREKDVLYVYYWSEPAFRYYAGFYGFDAGSCGWITEPDKDNPTIKEVDHYRMSTGKKKRAHPTCTCIHGVSESFDKSHEELKKLRRRGRVWFLFSHIGGNEKKFLRYLDRKGERLDEIVKNGASAYLYRLMEGEDTP